MKPAAQPMSVDEVLAMLAVSFNEAPGSIRPDSPRSSLAGWDSMGVLMLTAELDERFGVELESSESAKMRSIADLLQFMRERQLLRE
jgi:acyl carrier protein